MSKAVSDDNRLSLTYPEVAEEWHPTKNGVLKSCDVSFGSHRKVWWLCSSGHEWESIIRNRTRLGRKCPYCTHQKVLTGQTDFASVCPAAAKEWHPTKNGVLTPDRVLFGTHKKVWWLCSVCGYEWEAEIKSRYYGCGCPRCNRGQFFDVPTVGVDDLATVRQDLVNQWNYEKNYPLTPSDIRYGSGKRVWWICKNGHEYQMKIDNKIRGESCPICSHRRRSSLPEQTVFYYVKKVFPNAINSYKEVFDNGMELDIFIPEINTGIEYDGKIYHSSADNQLRDFRKYKLCQEKRIRLIRIAQDAIYSEKKSDELISHKQHNDSSLEDAIKKLFDILGQPGSVDINIKRDKLEILTYLESLDISLESEYPDIAKEFDISKNNGLLPSYFHAGSNEKVWWKCSKCGHEWMAIIASRTKDGDGCSKCGHIRGGKKRAAYNLEKNGSITDTNPELLEFWNYDKNDVRPSEMIAGTHRKVWWRCKLAHEWEASLDHVSKRGANCPFCSNKRILAGFNDLFTVNPKLALEWDYEKNEGLLPTTVGAGTAKKVWWRCGTCGHSWAAYIYSRNNGVGCPKCAVARRIGNQYAKKKVT